MCCIDGLKALLPDVNLSKWFNAKLFKVSEKICFLLNIFNRFLDLKYPCYNGNELGHTEETLFSDKEMFLMLDYERGSKNLVWNNFFIEIDKKKQY